MFVSQNVELAHQIQRQRLREAEAWRLARSASTSTRRRRHWWRRRGPFWAQSRACIGTVHPHVNTAPAPSDTLVTVNRRGVNPATPRGAAWV